MSGPRSPAPIQAGLSGLGPRKGTIYVWDLQGKGRGSGETPPPRPQSLAPAVLSGSLGSVVRPSEERGAGLQQQRPAIHLLETFILILLSAVKHSLFPPFAKALS